MLFLLFDLGKERYAIDVRQIRAVLPLLDLKRLTGVPPAVAGLCNYHGRPVPVIDLCEMVTGRRARFRLSTRLIIVRFAAHGTDHMLGLIAEQATETMRRNAEDFTSTGVQQADFPYLGPVTQLRGDLVQWVTVEHLLTEDVRDRLFSLALEQ